MLFFLNCANGDSAKLLWRSSSGWLHTHAELVDNEIVDRQAIGLQIKPAIATKIAHVEADGARTIAGAFA